MPTASVVEDLSALFNKCLFEYKNSRSIYLLSQDFVRSMKSILFVFMSIKSCPSVVNKSHSQYLMSQSHFLASHN